MILVLLRWFQVDCNSLHLPPSWKNSCPSKFMPLAPVASTLPCLCTSTYSFPNIHWSLWHPGVLSYTTPAMILVSKSTRMIFSLYFKPLTFFTTMTFGPLYHIHPWPHSKPVNINLNVNHSLSDTLFKPSSLSCLHSGLISFLNSSILQVPTLSIFSQPTNLLLRWSSFPILAPQLMVWTAPLTPLCPWLRIASTQPWNNAKSTHSSNPRLLSSTREKSHSLTKPLWIHGFHPDLGRLLVLG